MAATETRVTVRCTGTQTKILQVATEISRIFENQIVETSKIKKDMDDEFFHIFLTIELGKAPPKEQTDVKVREVR